MKTRIVQRTYPDGTFKYVIQQKHFLFRWWWVDAWVNMVDYTVTCEFDTYEKALKSSCWFDGSKSIDIVMPRREGE